MKQGRGGSAQGGGEGRYTAESADRDTRDTQRHAGRRLEGDHCMRARMRGHTRVCGGGGGVYTKFTGSGESELESPRRSSVARWRFARIIPLPRGLHHTHAHTT